VGVQEGPEFGVRADPGAEETRGGEHQQRLALIVRPLFDPLDKFTVVRDAQ
jgi:hypothetical protein